MVNVVSATGGSGFHKFRGLEVWKFVVWAGFRV